MKRPGIVVQAPTDTSLVFSRLICFDTARQYPKLKLNTFREANKIMAFSLFVNLSDCFCQEFVLITLNTVL